MSHTLGLAHTLSTKPLGALSTVMSFTSMEWGQAPDTAWSQRRHRDAPQLWETP
jgi:hypothetical protein